jgi:hypothetical protein
VTPLDEAAAALAPLFGRTPFELRYAPDGGAAVRAVGGPVAPRHAEPAPPEAPWVVQARCGDAVGWLLAAEPPADEGRPGALLQEVVAHHTALRLQRLAAERSALSADLLEHLTHRLRTDVSTLGSVAEGAARSLFAPSELASLPAALAEVCDTAQGELSAAREFMTVLDPQAPVAPEPLVETLEAELAVAGAEATVADGAAERARTRIPGAGWRACAQRLAEALAGDERLAGARLEVTPDAEGWRVGTAARTGEPLPWLGRVPDGLAAAGRLAVAAGGAVRAALDRDNRLSIALTVPAAASVDE